ncbi:MAG: GyrI-like domain-containing protein [Chloroflexi bacterium]|nr:GyrI-like domain-containing protein [Chloroflexota bacterium]MDA1240875.1 GyrI-like domain-containing protein [Chloroflexota bacterium]
MGQPMLLEAAIGLAAEVAGEGDVLASVIPAGDAVVTLHVGRFEDVGGAYEAVFAHAAAQSRQPAGAPYEVYLTSPETEPDPTKQRTEVVLPVA